MDRKSGARWRETPRLPVQSRCRTPWTGGAFVDDGRLTHNPEVAGSNPAPATNFRRSRPFPSRERAFCVWGTVVKRVAATALRAARQRDGGDGVIRDETAWTWWTLPPAISGCLAQRYPGADRSLRVRGGRAGARVAATGLGQACRMSARGMRLPGARDATLAQVQRRRPGHRGARCGALVPRAWRSVIGLPCQPERVTVRCAAIVRRS
jgi:hypothetical protein